MSTWTILNMINWLSDYLKRKSVPDARLNAEHLIAHTLCLSRMDLYLKFERILTDEELKALKPLIERRARREPLQYIIGTQPFRNVEIKVTRDVLIPRPETEVLVGEVLKQIPEESDAHILELCTGSGAIAAALASERGRIRITAIEISQDALSLARENTGQFRERVTLLAGDLFEPVKGNKFDAIVSNPPYCTLTEFETLEPEVREYEPREALLAGEDGLAFHRRILENAPNYLKANGWVFIEFGDGQASAVSEIVSRTGRFCNAKTGRDFNRKERFISAQMK